MSETIFTKVDYDLGSLINYISLGEIGLPDIQRPFVWKNSKVRNLFDSMYKGYPIGYLLFWQNALADNPKIIGSDSKQKTPKLLIVDGQQRLTSLYAILKGVSVVRENYETEKIKIAFNPIEEKFEVTDAAITRDKSFIPDISEVWDKDTYFLDVIENYINTLSSVREITDDERRKIGRSITKLHGLLSFPFTALELKPDISEEDVSDVFVRINGEGTKLLQSDFILTLMSVFWDEGRTELEKFCRESRQNIKGQSSPFNYFIEPSPAQLLRVSVGLGFKRARLRNVYSILRGKDLETEKFSDELRDKQFDVLKNSQAKVLNLQYWHDFLKCIRAAGFRSGKMISSENNLIFSYILYLIGRTEFNIEEYMLRKVIARWFFMSNITGRFTGSPESRMEFDLARLRGIKDGNDFINILDQICEVTLNTDFWNVSLPNYLATSAAISPALFGFHAALILLDAKVLFSEQKVSEMLDPAIQANKSAVERHHLFPKNYLNNKLNINSIRDVNQIANYALVEWGDNVKISDKAPSEYLDEFKDRFKDNQLKQFYYWHALPENWENMDYKEFLAQRRVLISNIIAEGYKALTTDYEIKQEEDEFILSDIIHNGESEVIEFKSTLRTNLHTSEKDQRIEHSVLKTIAGFLNSDGGTLIIGMSDDGTPLGIEADNFSNEDKMNLHLVNLVKTRIGPEFMRYIHPHFENLEDVRVLIVKTDKSFTPVYLKDNNTEKFYIRTGPSTTELTASQIQSYIKNRFSSH